jgi:cobaltochelatase CobS
MSEKITCQICGAQTHIIEAHLRKEHPEVTLEKYQEDFPGAALMSVEAEKAIAERRAQKAITPTVVDFSGPKTERRPMHEVFGFGNAPAAKAASGKPILIETFVERHVLTPDIDTGYIFNIGLTKDVLMAVDQNIPGYFWGHMGVGKSTVIEQVCAYTNRPMIRVQHTANMEEADLEGRWIVRNGEMTFELGPLAEAMEHGYLFLADEYDFASPMILSMYQAVLEGKPLFIKAANRKVAPHPNFRIIATGNTNGTGDESGLYMGTQQQNAANYERFGIVQKVEYMPQNQEVGIIINKTGISQQQAEAIVNFATMMRAAFDRRDVTFAMSPRSALRAAQIGKMKNCFVTGIKLAYVNRLPTLSAEVALQTASRLFS